MEREIFEEEMKRWKVAEVERRKQEAENQKTRMFSFDRK